MASTTGAVCSGARIPRSGGPSMVVSRATPAISFRGTFKPAATSAGNLCKAPITPSTSLAPNHTHGARINLLDSVDYFEVTCPAALVAKTGCTPACCIPGGPSAVPTFPISPAASGAPPAPAAPDVPPAPAAPNGPPAPAAPAVPAGQTSLPPEPQGVFITSAGYYSFQAAPVRRTATPIASLAAANGAPLR